MREFCELYKTLIELCNSTFNSAKSDIIISSSTQLLKNNNNNMRWDNNMRFVPVSAADGFCL